MLRHARRPRPLASLLCALTALAASGCSGDDPVDAGSDVSAALDAQADGAAALDVSADTGEADSVSPDTAAPDTAAPDTTEPDTAPADAGTPKVPCTENDECSTGYCLPTPDGRFCAEGCVSSCPTEFACKEVISGGDVLYVCAHKAPYRCNPCASDKDCVLSGGAQGRCIQLADGGFCAQPCDKGEACIGTGFTCGAAKAVGGADGGKVCLPEGGVCPCPDGKKGFCHVTNSHGSCPGTYLCEAGKAGSCQGQLPGPEQCNQKDDDCDGDTDEDVASVSCDLTNAYGTCKGKTLCAGGTTLCQGTNPAPEVCNGIDDNCSGETDEGSADTDQDKIADCIDPDDDNDGLADDKDNCPLAANASQTDNDKDGKGDACDPDDDDDGVFDDKDVCPFVADKAQLDTDKDGLGDACDCDIDADGVANAAADAVGCPTPATPDNCTFTANPKQLDTDKDGVGDACDGDKDGDGDPDDKDCAPEDPAISHNATELCDGQDNDCDGETDEEDAKGCGTFWIDQDADGYGAVDKKCLCKPKSVFSAKEPGDCNDKDKSVNPGAPEICGNGKDDNCQGAETDKSAIGCTDYYLDVDGDGLGTGEPVCLCAPSGQHTAKKDGDCDDEDATVSPTLTEKCADNKDNDCNGKTDEAGCLGCKTFFRDGDQDGFGQAKDTQCLSGPTFPYTAFTGGDCDDGDANVKPGALEVCNGKDDNCDQLKDPIGSTGCSHFFPDSDKDGYGAKVSSVCHCKANGVWTANKTGDCNDENKAIHPKAKEVCNNLDDNCNTQVDEGLIQTWFKDNDGDGYGSTSSLQACKQPKGYVAESGDCNDFNKAIHPKAKELCNLVDDDCNGFKDDGLAQVSIYADVDGDGFGSKNAKPQKHCLLAGNAAPLGYSVSKDDCDDSKSTVYPGAPELCDGILNNCTQAVADAHCPTKCEGSWPVFVGGASGFPVVAQLDGDNALEVVARFQGTVRVLKANGSELWKQSSPVSYGYPALADMNGDATADLVSPGHDKHVTVYGGGDGKVLAQFDIGTAAGWYGASVFDVNHDGALDIVSTGGSPYRLLLLDGSMKVKSSVTLAPLAGEVFSLAPVAIYDRAGDGVAELFLGSGTWGCIPNPTTCKGRLYAFDATGALVNDPTWKDKAKPWFQVANFPKSYAGEGRWPLWADLDGDGVAELFQPFSSSSSNLWKKDGTAHPLSGKAGVSSFPQVAPLKAGGLLDTSGKLSAVAGPVVDVDGDGTYETIYNVGTGLAVVKDGKPMDGYPLSIPAGTALVTDLNRDGRLDIVFASGKNNAVNCYTLGAGTYNDARVLHPGTVHGLGGGLYPTQNYDPFEPNDIRNKPFDPKTSKDPLKDSRALRISAMRETYSSGGGWSHKLRAVIGEQGDRDNYVLYGSIIAVSLKPMVRDLDLYVHVFKSDGTYLATRSSTNTGAGKGESVNCHSTNKCPAGAGYFVIEVRGKDAKKDFGPWPYVLTASWAY